MQKEIQGSAEKDTRQCRERHRVMLREIHGSAERYRVVQRVKG